MKIFSYVLKITLAILISITSVFAIEAPTSLVITENSESSVLVSWDAVDGASGYDVYYSTVSPIDIDDPATQKRLFIPESSVLVDGLTQGVTYYFVAASFDEVADGSDLSLEHSYTIESSNSQENQNVVSEANTVTDMNSAGEFKLQAIEVLAQNQVAVEFTASLDPSAEKIFKVVEKNDELLQYSVNDTKLDLNDSRKVLVTFDELLPVNTEFKLTVISILDNQGRNLESGIESFENFIVEEDKLNYVYQEEVGGIVVINEDNTTTIVEIQEGNNNTDNSGSYNSNIDNTNVDTQGQVSGEEKGNNQTQSTENTQESTTGDTQNVSDQSGAETDNSTVENNDTQVDGTNMSSEEIAVDLLSAGQEAETLPKTWAEHIFMLILALVFGAISFVFKYRKS